MLKVHCLSSLGEQEVDVFSFSKSLQWITTSLKQTHEFKTICLFEDSFPLEHYFDVREHLNKIKVQGTFLTHTELFDLKRSLETIKAVVRFFKKQEEEEKYPELRKLIQEVKLYPFVYDKIDKIVNKHGNIKDNASPRLAEIRRELSSKQAAISRISNKIMSKAIARGLVDKDTSLSVRGGKMLIPLPVRNKRKIKGFVQDESATGKTVYVEPVEVAEMHNNIRELEFAEKREITKILIHFADDIRPYLDDLLLAYEFLGKIDFIRAKALLALDINGEMPKVNDKPVLDLRVAIHPLLYLSLKKENKKVVPLDIELHAKREIVLISGPNAGGKSVCLKTTGLLQYMLQSGLLIPVHPESSTGIFHKFFIDIGDEQSIENDLSTYSSHLSNMKFFLENVDENSLILIDEFGSGTEPLMGGAIAESILEVFNQRHAKGVITTHYTNLKHMAGEIPRIENGAMLFDNKKLEPVFQLKIGQPGSSFAFEIAGKRGIPKEILDAAASKVGHEHIDFEKQLREIEIERKELQEQKQKLEKREKDLQKSIDQYEKELEHNLDKRKNILSLSREQAKEMLETVNKKIENTIFEIRKEQAEKEKTKKLRKEVENFKTAFLEKQENEQIKLDEKIERLKRKKAEKAQKKKKKVSKKSPERPKKIIADTEIHEGDKVKIKNQHTPGEVLEIKGKQALVSFGLMKTSIDKKRLVKIPEEEYQQQQQKSTPASSVQQSDWTLDTSKVDFKPGIDIRGKRADEALATLQKYLDKAIMVNAGEVKILHGTGNGILRQIVRDYLDSVDFIEKYHDEKVDQGGTGITVVKLST